MGNDHSSSEALSAMSVLFWIGSLFLFLYLLALNNGERKQKHPVESLKVEQVTEELQEATYGTLFVFDNRWQEVAKVLSVEGTTLTYRTGQRATSVLQFADIKDLAPRIKETCTYPADTCYARVAYRYINTQ